mmetsp:Transcript_17927/g.42889  ORF Transcript_17927/g.42889 Transcript_17927/m.42889 type:complete len:206 (+) Transcript_17927:354-971(+)
MSIGDASSALAAWSGSDCSAAIWLRVPRESGSCVEEAGAVVEGGGTEGERGGEREKGRDRCGSLPLRSCTAFSPGGAAATLTCIASSLFTRVRAAVFDLLTNSSVSSPAFRPPFALRSLSGSAAWPSSLELLPLFLSAVLCLFSFSASGFSGQSAAPRLPCLFCLCRAPSVSLSSSSFSFSSCLSSDCTMFLLPSASEKYSSKLF